MEKNVVLFVIDALRADHLGCYGYDKNTSPNIDKLAKEGIKFNNAFCCANITDPSLTSIMSGRYPISHGIRNHGVNKITKKEIKKYHKSNTTLLSEVLKEKRYKTIGLDWLGRWHTNGFGYYSGNIKKSRSFRFGKKFLNKIPDSISGKIKRIYHSRKKDNSSLSNMPNAKELIEESKSVISKDENPFFLLVHMWDTHTPYNVNAPRRMCSKFLDENGEDLETVFKKIKREGWENFLRNATDGCETTSEVDATYDSAIKFVDNQIGEFVKFLKEKNLYEDTIIVITSDHGESLTEHGIYYDHHGLYDQTTRVPLIITNLGLDFSEVEGLIQHVDLFPSILDELGIGYKHLDIDGKSICGLRNDDTDDIRPYIYCEETLTTDKRMIRTKRWKYIKAKSKNSLVCSNCGFKHGDEKELYNLVNDPEEKNNVYDENIDISSDLDRKLEGFIGRLKEKGSRKEKEKLVKGINKIDADIKI